MALTLLSSSTKQSEKLDIVTRSAWQGSLLLVPVASFDKAHLVVCVFCICRHCSACVEPAVLAISRHAYSITVVSPCYRCIRLPYTALLMGDLPSGLEYTVLLMACLPASGGKRVSRDSHCVLQAKNFLTSINCSDIRVVAPPTGRRSKFNTLRMRKLPQSLFDVLTFIANLWRNTFAHCNQEVY